MGGTAGGVVNKEDLVDVAYWDMISMDIFWLQGV